MNNKLNFEIKNFGLINEVSMELNKINVVGGINSSGKSTASKLLYCLLKANSSKRKEYLSVKIISNIIKLINEINPQNYHKFSLDDNYSDIIKIYDELKKGYNKEDNNLEITSIIQNIEYFIELRDLDENKLSSAIIEYLLNHESLEKLINKSYYYCGEEYGIEASAKIYSKDFESSIISTLYGIDENNIFIEPDNDFKDEYFYYLTKNSFNDINDVFYISPVSIFDVKRDYDIFSKLVNRYDVHIQDLLDDLETSSNLIDKSLKKKINLVREKIERILQGNFNKHGYLNNEFYSSKSTTTSSGIKQIGIVQILLNNNKLIPGTFLIIDEPEVNLHPEWQFKFAGILVLIAKELDVKIYINSHSPLFIESLDAFTEYHDMEDEISFYLSENFYDEEGGFYIIHDHMEKKEHDLTKEFESYHKFNFTKIESNELYKIYNNLGNPYHLIDQLRLKKKFGE